MKTGMNRLSRGLRNITAMIGVAVCLVGLFAVPASAAEGFTLGPGEYQFQNQPQSQYWRIVNLDVDKAGKFSFSGRKNVTDTGVLRNGSKYSRVTTYDIDIEGVYDADQGTFSGDFTIERDWVYDIKPKEGSGRHEEGSGSFSGPTISGQVKPGDKSVKLTFVGTDKDSWHSSMLDGRKNGEKDYSYSRKSAEIVTFPVQGSIAAPEESDTPKVEDSGARFSDLAGQIEWRPHDDEEAWRLAKLDDVLPVDAHIKTSDKSTAIISFADMTTFTLKPDSEVVLSSPAAKDSQIQLLWGNLKANVKKMLKDGSMEIEMSQAVAGIKGTILVLEETKDKSTLKVLKGVVAFTAKSGGQVATVKAGQQISATPKGLGRLTSFDTKKEESRWPVEGLGGSKFPISLVLGGLALVLMLGGVGFAIARRSAKAA